MSTAIRSSVVNMFHLYKKPFSPKNVQQLSKMVLLNLRMCKFGYLISGQTRVLKIGVFGKLIKIY